METFGLRDEKRSIRPETRTHHERSTKLSQMRLGIHLRRRDQFRLLIGNSIGLIDYLGIRHHLENRKGRLSGGSFRIDDGTPLNSIWNNQGGVGYALRDDSMEN